MRSVRLGRPTQKGGKSTRDCRAAIPRSATMTERDGWPEFTDDDVRRIVAWLPEEIDLRRRKLLPQILREWARVDLPEHFAREPVTAVRERRERLAQLGKVA